MHDPVWIDYINILLSLEDLIECNSIGYYEYLEDQSSNWGNCQIYLVEDQEENNMLLNKITCNIKADLARDVLI
jgi:hypothetical protein